MSVYNQQRAIKINRHQTVTHNGSFGRNVVPAFSADPFAAGNNPGKFPAWFRQLLEPAANTHLHTWYAEKIYPDPED